MRWLAALLVLMLAGCLNGPAPVDESSQGRDEGPTWSVGDWWTYEYVRTPRTGLTDTFTVVVADETDTHYLVGMPDDDFSDLAIIYHTPPTGEVRKSDLAWDTHDLATKWMEFPVEVGSQWTTNWWGTPDVPAWVEAANETDVVVGMFARGAPMQYVYSHEAQAMARWPAVDGSNPGFDLRLVEWGSNYVGDVRIPEGQDLTIYHGVYAGALPTRLSPGTMGTPVQSPSETITVPEGYDAMTVAILLAPLTEPETGTRLPATARMIVTAPDGTRYQDALEIGDGPSILLWHEDDPVGPWSYEATTNASEAVLEAIAYKERIVTLGEP